MKVSIITITYNSAATLAATLASVARQDYAEIEHILVDGNSTDGSQQILSAYAAQRSRVHYISEQDNGIYDAINKGIRRATGDIIGILNSDDVLASPEVISHIVHAFQSAQSPDVVYGDLVYCNGEKVIRRWKSNAFNPKSLKYGWMPPHPTLYCLRKVYEEQGLYDDRFRISADYDFMLRVFKQNYRVTYLPEVLVRMSIGGASNRNLHALLRKSYEDMQAMRKNHVGAGALTVAAKILRKCKQFLRK